MSDDRVEIPQEIVDKLVKDPTFLQKLKRKQELEDFRSKYGVKRATPFKCPSCTAYLQSGGTLWGPMENAKDQYVCRKCELVWKVQCLTEPNDVIALKIRQLKKGEAVDFSVARAFNESESKTIEAGEDE